MTEEFNKMTDEIMQVRLGQGRRQQAHQPGQTRQQKALAMLANQPQLSLPNITVRAMPPRRCTEHTTRYRAGCNACQAWSNWYNRRRLEHHAAGRWQPMVPIGTVRDHVARLRAGGMRVADIAAAAGMSTRHLETILANGTQRHVSPTLAGQIFAVRVRLTPRSLVDATGTRRRLRALQAIGWPHHIIAERLSVDVSLPGKWATGRRVMQANAARVAALYDELSMSAGPCGRSRAAATRNGWPSPLAWDDETIDDPAAQPIFDVPPPPRPTRTQILAEVANRRAEVDRLDRAGLTIAKIAARLEIGERSVNRHLQAIRAAAQNAA